ncbi:hypothetical protein VNO77_35496 [Canavalia gladiata]|uniref:Uncharacterized protein n=1 Tax=Canavalia gladiata TaxID=3824 RepID=A0AAN9KFE5_CANGL
MSYIYLFESYPRRTPVTDPYSKSAIFRISFSLFLATTTTVPSRESLQPSSSMVSPSESSPAFSLLHHRRRRTITSPFFVSKEEEI